MNDDKTYIYFPSNADVEAPHGARQLALPADDN